MPGSLQDKAVTVELFNSNGVQVKSAYYTHAGQTENLTMGGVAKGFYLVKVTGAGTVLQSSIVKN
jgi:hypothetical protein